MTRTGYAWDPVLLGHEPPNIHPEHPQRLQVLETAGIMADLPGLERIKIDRELGLPWISRVHSQSYVSHVRSAFESGISALDKVRETLVQSDTYEVALASSSGALSVVAAVSSGVVDNGFAAIRPPGHHSGESYTRGFCVFNNAAACARYAQEIYGHGRVLIIDWDVHPADGTAAIFYEDPSVHVLSVHQRGIFSESVGLEHQTGRDQGTGTTYNVNVAEGATGSDYMRALEPALELAAARCRPDIVLISCGFDAHAGESISATRLQEADFARLTEVARRVADHYAGGRLVSLLEGGYNPHVLRRCVVRHLEALME